MSIAQTMLPEFDQEMASTRKMLERVPDDKLEYKPSEKSMPLGALAGHVVEMIGWTAETINSANIDIPADYKPRIYTSRQELLEQFDQNVASARPALEGCSDAAMMENWSLKFNGETLFTMPRIACLRSLIMNHVIHHRAQLSVYYRMVGVPVPGMYGPSADEKQSASA